MRHLEEAKPAGRVIDLSDLEEAQHMDCMRSLVHVLVHSSEEDASPGSMGVIYQYCPGGRTR